MADGYLGQIMLFAGTFAPQGYAPCDGRLLAISDYDALYTLLGTTYGGDGINNFGVPDLRGAVPIHQGQGTGLSNRVLGETGGSETVALTTSNLPSHTHAAAAVGAAGTTNTPAANTFLASQDTGTVYMYGPYNSAAQTALKSNSVSASGGNQPHENMQPYVATTFCIATVGLYPSQN